MKTSWQDGTHSSHTRNACPFANSMNENMIIITTTKVDVTWCAKGLAKTKMEKKQVSVMVLEAMITFFGMTAQTLGLPICPITLTSLGL
jgi:hypothetical protein